MQNSQFKTGFEKSQPHKNTFNKREVTKINIYPWLYKGMKRQHVSQHSLECSGKNYYCFMGMQCGCGMVYSFLSSAEQS